MFSHFNRIVFFSVFCAGIESMRVYYGLEPAPRNVLLLQSVGMAILLVWWVEADAKVTGYRPCFLYGEFLFWAWPIAVPHYVIKTRGLLRGVLLSAVIFTLFSFPDFIAYVVYGMLG